MSVQDHLVGSFCFVSYIFFLCDFSLLRTHRNVAVGLVSKGLAHVIRYRQDDDQRSSQYDVLMTAEAEAISQQKGMLSHVDGFAYSSCTILPESCPIRHGHRCS